MHYKNGREAKIGDAVVGTVFNNGGAVIAGTLVSVTPGPDTCSAMVGFVTTFPVEEDSFRRGYVVVNGKPVYFSAGLIKVQGTEKHGSDGPVAVTIYTQDYTECKNLLHAEDAAAAATPIMCTAQMIDYADLIDQEKKAHEELRGTSGHGHDYEEGYINAHDSIKTLILTAQESLKLEPGEVINEQPLVDNAHVAEGCEQFAA